MEGARRTLVLALAATAGLVLAGVVAVVALAPDSAPLLLGLLLAVLVAVVVVEVALVLLDRRAV